MMEVERIYYPVSETSINPVPEDDDATTPFAVVSSPGVTRSTRVLPPSHYRIKFNSFSTLSSISEKYASDIFEAGGHQWIFSLYPRGDKERNGEGFVSVSLAYAEPFDLPLGLDINVIFKFFLYDHVRDNYLTVQDGEGRVRRFNATKTEHGISQLIPLSTFNHASNGYLWDDSCEFGVEIFVLKNNVVGDCLSVFVEESDNLHYTWTVTNFSTRTLNLNYIVSEEFLVGHKKWRLGINREASQKSDYISLHLGISDYLIPNSSNSSFLTKLGGYIKRCLLKKNDDRKMYVEAIVRVVDQTHSQHVCTTVKHWFGGSSYRWSCTKFVRLNVLHKRSKGYLVDDRLIIEVMFNLMYGAEEFC